jgi:membrane-bound lytic murein transglycosylase MltF
MRALAIIAILICSPIAVCIANQQRDPELESLLKQALVEEEQCFQDRFDREVFFKAMEPRLKRFVTDEQERTLILDRVHCEAQRLRLPPGLILAVIDVESRFDRWAVSSAGAVGLMQVMPFWPKQLGMTNAQLVKIPQNIRMGSTILRFYLDRSKGDYTKALARYNGSANRRDYPDKVLTRLADRWHYR